MAGHGGALLSWEVALQAAALLGAGIGSGLLAGLFGVGGGSIVVTALYHAFTLAEVPENLRMQLSFGTAFAIMVPTSAVSFVGHLRRGSADHEVARNWIAPVAIGVSIGSIFAARMSSVSLQLLFVALVVLNAVKLLTGWPAWRSPRESPSAVAMHTSGFVIGLLSAMIGIGGGIFGNFFLTAHGRTIRQAIGTTASLGAIISVVGTLNYALLGIDASSGTPAWTIGFVSVLAFAIVAPVAAATAPLGVRLAHRFTLRQLRVLFSLFLLVVAARFAFIAAQGLF
jgi:uncharacterized protein